MDQVLSEINAGSQFYSDVAAQALTTEMGELQLTLGWSMTGDVIAA